MSMSTLTIELQTVQLKPEPDSDDAFTLELPTSVTTSHATPNTLGLSDTTGKEQLEEIVKASSSWDIADAETLGGTIITWPCKDERNERRKAPILNYESRLDNLERETASLRRETASLRRGLRELDIASIKKEISELTDSIERRGFLLDYETFDRILQGFNDLIFDVHKRIHDKGISHDDKKKLNRLRYNYITHLLESKQEDSEDSETLQLLDKALSCLSEEQQETAAFINEELQTKYKHIRNEMQRPKPTLQHAKSLLARFHNETARETALAFLDSNPRQLPGPYEHSPPLLFDVDGPDSLEELKLKYGEAVEALKKLEQARTKE
ncbi:hypothetical protein C8J56DRAFT_1027324 [Mycena floridula]|nr:hypothetical protein C8J56DRAFT_1027324 [Mycena floridula]